MTNVTDISKRKAQLDRMYRRMKELGISEAELARRLYGPDTPQARVGNWKQRGAIPAAEMPAVARVLDMDFEELYYGPEYVGSVISTRGTIRYYRRPDVARAVPVLSYGEASDWADNVREALEDEDRERVWLEPDESVRISRVGFALDVKGDSMTPEYQPGDRVVIDPNEPVQPGDIVAARDEYGQVVLRKYRARGKTADGETVYELVPVNSDYPVVEFRGKPGDGVIGPVVEHRRYLRPRD